MKENKMPQVKRQTYSPTLDIIPHRAKLSGLNRNFELLSTEIMEVNAMRTGQGTGEYGILVNSLDDYHKIVTLQFARAVVKIIAMRHGITLPKVIGWKAHSKHWGQYSQLDNTIRLTKPISFGVVIHEGCHAVILQKYPYAPAHRSEFKSLLASEFRHFDL